MGGVKDLAKEALYQALRNPIGEALLYEGARRVPRSLQEPVFRRLAPQPKNYTRGSLRSVRRRGFQLELDPADYFQWHHYFGFHDEVLETLKRLAQGSRRILDIGANIGLYALSMAHVAPAAQVAAIEPNPATFARLSRHQALNQLRNLQCLQLAIGAQPGDLLLRDAGEGDSGKFTLRPGVEAAGTKVSVVTLAGLLERLGWDALDLVKIDVEGFEPEVFAGARSALLAHRPTLVFELTPGWYGDRTPGLVSDLRGLLDAGYTAFRIAPEPGEPRPMDLISSLERGSAPQYNVLLRPSR